MYNLAQIVKYYTHSNEHNDIVSSIYEKKFLRANAPVWTVKRIEHIGEFHRNNKTETQKHTHTDGF